MANTFLKFIVDMEDRTGGGFKSVSAGITGINQALEVARKIVGAFKDAFEFTEQAAHIQMTEERFDRLARTIGTTGDVLGGEIQRAMGGLVSKSEALALGTDLMSLGLVKTKEEAVRLSTVAGKLGMDMNQLVLTLTNQTTMRFDALGVSVDGFQDKVDALVDAGHSIDEAFRLAFVQQSEEQIEKVGDVADTSAGHLEMLKAAYEDLGDYLKGTWLELLGPALSQWAEKHSEELLFEEQLRISLKDAVISEGDALQLELAYYQDGAEGLKYYNKELYDAVTGHWEFIESLGGEEEAFLALNPEVAKWKGQLEAAARAEAILEDRTEDLNEDLKTTGEMMREAEDAAFAAIGDIDGMADAMANLIDAMAADDYEQGWRKLIREIAEAGGPESMGVPVGTDIGEGSVVFRGRTYNDAYWEGDTLIVRGQPYGTYPGRQATGGKFTVGGRGGIDSTPVGFMATPGETVTVGGGTTDMENMLAELRRMITILPVALKDAVERAS